MTAGAKLSAQVVLAAALIGVCGALGAWMLLDAIARPKAEATRRAALEATLQRAQTAMARGRRGAAYRDGAICPGLGDDEMAALRQTLTADGEGLALANLALTPEEAAGDGGQARPVRLRLEAAGAYDAALAWLDRLSQDAPRLFVDRLDVVGQGMSVKITLSGRVYCWNSGHP